METIDDQIGQLMLKREKNKQELFEKQALQLRNKERYFVYGESTSVADRLALATEIAYLEADRQRTKVELLKLKVVAREARDRKLVHRLIAALEANGLQAEITEARREADDAIKYEGLFEAYSANV